MLRALSVLPQERKNWNSEWGNPGKTNSMDVVVLREIREDRGGKCC